MNQDKMPQLKDTKKPQKAQQQDDDFIPRPDRSKFLDEMKSLRSELDTAKAQLAKFRQEIDSQSGNSGQSPEETKLREEHSAVISERNALRDAERKVTSEAERIEESVKRKIAELQALRPKNGPRSVKELDAKISHLESTMDSGSLSIVEEQRVLKEVAGLKKQRATFGQADKLQAEIDEVRKKAADLRKAIDQSAIRKVSARKAELEKQLDTYKEARQTRRSKMNSVFDKRREVQAKIKDINNQLDALRKDFDKRMDEFNAKLKAKKQQREAEEKEAKAEQAKQKKVADAQAKLDAAREPAFGSNIEQAKSLLSYLDPSFTDDDPANKPTTTKSQTRPVPVAQQPVSRAPPSRKSQKMKSKESKESSTNGKLNFDFSIIETFATLNIALPTSANEIEATKEKIKEKIAYYTENSERVTKEKVERAEKELQQVLAQFNSEATPAKQEA